MSDVIIYLLKVASIHGLLYLFYLLFLRTNTHHQLNRWYILASLFLALVIPFLTLSIPEPVSTPLENNRVTQWIIDPQPIPFATPIAEDTTTGIGSLLPWVYAIIVLFLVVKSILHIYGLKRLRKHSQLIIKRWFTLYKTDGQQPFSFFSNVFVPQKLFGSTAFAQVLEHECAHVRQHHSVDRLILDFFVSLFWFNPFIYLYRNALIEIHEFLADEAVIKKHNDALGYQEVLYAQLTTAEYPELVSHFNFSTIKKRIVMMNKQKRKQARLIYVLVLPLLVSVTLAFSSKDAIVPIEKVGNDLASLMTQEAVVPDEAITRHFTLSTDENSETPSIVPLKRGTPIEITSNFGMRMHPVLKEEKMHLGVDFKCPIGSEVVATADAKVSSIQKNAEGYGNMITLDHGNGYVTRYAQLSAFKISEGEQVKRRDVIGLSGNSGASTGPHLHYEVIKDGKHVNPLKYVPAPPPPARNPDIKEVPPPPPPVKETKPNKVPAPAPAAKETKPSKVPPTPPPLEETKKERPVRATAPTLKQKELEEKRLNEVKLAQELAKQESELARMTTEQKRQAAELEAQRTQLEIAEKEMRQIREENKLSAAEEMEFRRQEKLRQEEAHIHFRKAVEEGNATIIINGKKARKKEALGLDRDNIQTINFIKAQNDEEQIVIITKDRKN